MPPVVRAGSAVTPQHFSQQAEQGAPAARRFPKEVTPRAEPADRAVTAFQTHLARGQAEKAETRKPTTLRRPQPVVLAVLARLAASPRGAAVAVTAAMCPVAIPELVSVAPAGQAGTAVRSAEADLAVTADHPAAVPTNWAVEAVPAGRAHCSPTAAEAEMAEMPKIPAQQVTAAPQATSSVHLEGPEALVK